MKRMAYAVLSSAVLISSVLYAEEIYILPESDSAYLNWEDIDHLTATQARLARNEIYARHGYIFVDHELDAYFRNQSWYIPTTLEQEFDVKKLSELEQYNVHLLKMYEHSGDTAQLSFSSSPTEYIVPLSSAVYLETKDIDHLTLEQAGIAKNEIFAKHGCIFDSVDLEAYFVARTWYNPSVKADHFNVDVFSVIEKHNIELLEAYIAAGVEPSPGSIVAPQTNAYYADATMYTKFTENVIGFDFVSFYDRYFNDMASVASFVEQYKFDVQNTTDLSLAAVNDDATTLYVKLNAVAEKLKPSIVYAKVPDYNINLTDAREMLFAEAHEWQEDTHYVVSSFEDGVAVSYFFNLNSLRYPNPSVDYITITKDEYH